ncbi:hypothetical protein FBULB1_2163 [Fusarium bulbicola]|nr:hypothetical protein FBULB1_2163 [Fusarium bulbicola]
MECQRGESCLLGPVLDLQLGGGAHDLLPRHPSLLVNLPAVVGQDHDHDGGCDQPPDPQGIICEKPDDYLTTRTGEQVSTKQSQEIPAPRLMCPHAGHPQIMTEVMCISPNTPEICKTPSEYATTRASAEVSVQNIPMKYQATNYPALPHNASPRFLYILRLIVREDKLPLAGIMYRMCTVAPIFRYGTLLKIDGGAGAGAKMVVCEHKSMHTDLDGFKKYSKDPGHTSMYRHS